MGTAFRGDCTNFMPSLQCGRQSRGSEGLLFTRVQGVGTGEQQGRTAKKEAPRPLHRERPPVQSTATAGSVLQVRTATQGHGLDPLGQEGTNREAHESNVHPSSLPHHDSEEEPAEALRHGRSEHRALRPPIRSTPQNLPAEDQEPASTRHGPNMGHVTSHPHREEKSQCLYP
ncbi:hypothetical protein AAFF_G00244540 [Aldrovandia affinis]|uniref:Uncharacterized protein n=1 Tax=Aldrovandia affinis TaxID=143900 RepID=A0AAD7RDT0_9TELE|nr:hypothetical protein AAFF_G00244540 [Aldrovandia affinis]